MIQGSVATLRSCCIAPSSTVDGSVHMRIETRAPGTSVYDMAAPPGIGVWDTQRNGKKATKRHNRRIRRIWQRVTR
ncbi:hypothetical protein SBRY_10032 [Actinacidiphila bryophytorum]|uniref:Uncharacterized protein n=1 Tax=Actinacidiphila bryophytorum TaxID=1436133 RepID=A0A9W4DZQ5_9ACTN|nr:hypothetical protein SBRY_10032 [Actinacidiphila bryophytorum]